MMNMISTTRTWEACSVNSRSNANNERKRPRHEGGATSSKFKGVVLQQNRHWGAQIYANHQRIWLGTFKTEKEAAMAYDSAAIKLRSNDTHRNFPWSSLTFQEPYFQKDYSTEAILNMIKDGSYPSKFEKFVRNQSLKEDIGGGVTSSQLSIQGKGKISCRQLFQKELTPSDVGKLNRLVIPKKYAVEYFPRFVECENEKDIATDGGSLDDVLLTFYDRLMRTWEFRYCYWKSSQSFVFTRGWNRFVKEKELQANDTVTFYICEPMEKAIDYRPFYLIDVSYKLSSNNNGRLVHGVSQYVEQEKFQKNVGQSNDTGFERRENVVVEENLDLGLGRTNSFRLFGVQISRS